MAETILEAITRERSLPQMVFSVLGDTNSFVPCPWPKSVLQSAITSAAKNAGDSWIFFAGRQMETAADSNFATSLVGVSEVLRESVQEHHRVEFYDSQGQLKENHNVPYMHLLSIHQDDTVTSKTVEVSTYEITKKMETETERSEQESKLLKVRVNFPQLRPDNDEDEKPKNELELIKVNLEKLFSKETVAFMKDSSSDIRIPVLIIVVEGDQYTVKHVAEAVQKGLPVIIIKGTGKAADLILEYIEKPEENCLKRKAAELFGFTFTTSNVQQLKEEIDKIVSKSYLISVFDINEDDPMKMSDIAGEAVVNAWAMENANNSLETTDENEVTNYSSQTPNGILRPVTTGVLRTRPEHDQIASTSASRNTEDRRRNVLSSRKPSPASLPLHFYVTYQHLKKERTLGQDEGKRLLLEALKANRADYVQVLLDDGVKFDSKYFSELYETTVRCTNCDIDAECLHIQWILRQADRDSTTQLLRFVNQDHKSCFNRVQCSSSQTKRSVTGFARMLCKAILNYKVEKDKDEEGEDIIGSLLLWSIFANRPDISQVLWHKSNNQLLTAIISGVVLKRLSEQASKVRAQNLANELKKHALLFEERGMQMMDKLYELNPDVAIDLIDDTQEVWDIDTSPLTFAHENFMYDFIAHTCPQRWLNKIWYNDLAPDLWPYMKSALDCKFWTAPILRFILNYILFLGMLVSFSAYVLTSIDDNNYSRPVAKSWEWYTYAWTLGDLCMAIFLVVGKGIFVGSGGKTYRSIGRRAFRYIYDFWNAIDILSYILLVVALIVRHPLRLLMDSNIDPDYVHSRRLFSCSLLVMFLRYLQVFRLTRTLGPKLVMIKDMLVDLMYFLFIAVIVIAGVGVFYHANLFPNHLAIIGPGWVPDWNFWKIFYYPYWQLYGETFNEYLEGKDLSDCTFNSTIYYNDPSANRCPQEEWSVSVVSAFYMLISNLLLVNLVIAMFSYTFAEVQENSEKIWKFQRYTVITDYKVRIPSPLNILIVVFGAIPFLVYRMKNFGCKCGTDEKKNKELLQIHIKEMQDMIASRC